MPENASKRWSFIGEMFTHSGGVLLCAVSFKTFFADLHWYLSLPKAGWRSRHNYAKVKKCRIEATLLLNRGNLPSVTLVEQVLRGVCRFVSATQHASNVGYEQLFRADKCTKKKEFQWSGRAPTHDHWHDASRHSSQNATAREVFLVKRTGFTRIDTQAKCENARRVYYW